MPAKHALLVGVDHYCNLEDQYQLGGCVNDAKVVKNVLATHFGFDDRNITELHDGGATRDAILEAMNTLVDTVDKDDIVVFHFSGHGSRRTAADLSKGTGKDSTIMPHDSGRHPLPNLDIVNDEINDWLQRLTKKTGNVSLTFDCCHSGTVTRDAFADTVRAVPDDTRSLEEMGIDRDSLPKIDKPATRGAGDTNWIALADRYVVMSGCRDNELSHEYTREDGGDKIRNGALTHFLTNALVKAKPGTTYRDVFELAHQGVNTKYPTQNPQIEGARDRELFGTREIEPLRFVPIASVDGDNVVLDGGAAHGVVSGSVWSVLPRGTKKKAGAKRLGALEITSVDALTSQAKVLDKKGELEAGARCIEKEPSPEQFLLKVDLGELPGSNREILAAAIGKSDLVAEATTAEGADIRAYVLEPRSKSSNPVPSVETVQEQSWALVNSQGALAMPMRATSQDTAAKVIVENLETLSRYNNALQLDNPDDDLDVEFNIYRESGKDQWEKVNGGDHTFSEGDCIAFELVNKEDKPVFLSVLDFGLSGKVSLLYPPRTTSELIDAGKTLQIGMGKRRIRAGLPDGFSAAQGTGALKAFVTSEEADFQWLQQEGTRSAETAKSGLRKQFEAAYNGPVTRDMSFDEEDEETETWIAMARSFEIRRGKSEG